MTENHVCTQNIGFHLSLAMRTVRHRFSVIQTANRRIFSYNYSSFFNATLSFLSRLNTKLPLLLHAFYHQCPIVHMNLAFFSPIFRNRLSHQVVWRPKQYVSLLLVIVEVWATRFCISVCSNQPQSSLIRPNCENIDLNKNIRHRLALYHHHSYDISLRCSYRSDNKWESGEHWAILGTQREALDIPHLPMLDNIHRLWPATDLP